MFGVVSTSQVQVQMGAEAVCVSGYCEVTVWAQWQGSKVGGVVLVLTAAPLVRIFFPASPRPPETAGGQHQTCVCVCAAKHTHIHTDTHAYTHTLTLSFPLSPSFSLARSGAQTHTHGHTH